MQWLDVAQRMASEQVEISVRCIARASDCSLTSWIAQRSYRVVVCCCVVDDRDLAPTSWAEKKVEGNNNLQCAYRKRARQAGAALGQRRLGQGRTGGLRVNRVVASTW